MSRLIILQVITHGSNSLADRRLSIAGPVKDSPVKPKKSMIKRIVILLFAAASLITGVTACHTAHGAGEDIENAGQKVQENTPP